MAGAHNANRKQAHINPGVTPRRGFSSMHAETDGGYRARMQPLG